MVKKTLEEKEKLIQDYNASSVSVIEQLKHILEVPSMYLGSISNPQHTVEEAIMNSMDEVQIGVADKLWITYNEDYSITVRDNGRGIPPLYSEKFGMPTVRGLLTVVNSGKGFNSSDAGSSRHGIGMKATTATSDWLEVRVWRDKYEWYDRYELINGNPGTPVVKLKNNELPKKKNARTDIEHGTEVTWLPSSFVWESIKFDWPSIKKLMHELCYLNPGLTVYLDNKIINEQDVYCEKGGTNTLIDAIVKNNKTKLITPIYKFNSVYNTGEKIGKGKNISDLLIKADITFAWSDSNQTKYILYTNNVPNPLGGTPIKGLYSGITKIINKYAKELNLSKDTIEQRDIIPGLIAVINLSQPNPNFDGQTKKEITSTNSKTAIASMVFEDSQILFDRTIDSIKDVIKESIKRFNDRKKELDSKVNLKSKDVKRKINKKLSPARKLGINAELFIVEGDSAGGTVVEERNTDNQAVLPIRGKILNTYKASAAKNMKNEEISTLFGAVGTGIGDSFDIKKSNYGKIIITTDADTDGGAISCLLLTAIFKYTPDLIRMGYVHRVMSPLFINTMKNGKIIYTYNDIEQKEFINVNKPKSVKRNKGLGELSNDIVYETIINKETRRLKQFRLDEDNEEEFYEMVEKFMGKNVQERREIFFNPNMYN